MVLTHFKRGAPLKRSQQVENLRVTFPAKFKTTGVQKDSGGMNWDGLVKGKQVVGSCRRSKTLHR